MPDEFGFGDGHEASFARWRKFLDGQTARLDPHNSARFAREQDDASGRIAVQLN
jgi:hypothetical protein